MHTVLVVDDAALDRRIAGGFVEQEGSRPIYAENGVKALEIIRQEEPAIVLTDLQMPEMDGLELVRQIRENHPRVPVILMTAHGSEDIAVAALRAGAASYVAKKNLKRDLGQALQVVLAAVEAVQQRDQVRNFLERAESYFVMGYEPAGPQALISYLQDSLSQLNFCDEVARLQISTALTEALTNAIDHGNLELDSALRESPDDAYRNLRSQRAQQSPYRDRRVRVTATLTPSEAIYVIQDDGPGFDPSLLPDPRDPENLVKPSGRGVLLIRTFMDDVSFNEIGNEITMVKRRAADG
jgi:CheY-like chemotaxis protein/anti-sigma regulatory factor (Ser/Thr protein kinase)